MRHVFTAFLGTMMALAFLPPQGTSPAWQQRAMVDFVAKAGSTKQAFQRMGVVPEPDRPAVLTGYMARVSDAWWDCHTRGRCDRDGRP